MKKPLKPPYETISKIITENPDRWLEIVNFKGDLKDTKYLHWDQMYHMTPPKGLSREEWWLAIIHNRDNSAKDLPMWDKERRRLLRWVMTNPIPERLHQIDFNAGSGAGLPSAGLSDETRDIYYVSSLIEEAFTSSRLEGALTTRRVAKDLIRTGRKPADKAERMVLNNYLTMKEIRDFKDEPLTKELVFKIHSLITQGTLDDPTDAGRLRTAADDIAVVDEKGQLLHTPPDPNELPERMEAMCRFANDKSTKKFIHPVIRSIILHFWLAYDHPFVDGNGRTARTLFYWSMLRHGYELFEFISISSIILKGPSKYLRAFLYTESDENDLTYFILYHLDVIRRAVDALNEYIRRKTQELRALEQRLRGLAALNHRQRALINHALHHPGERYTIYGHRMSHDTAYETARSDLLHLEREGLFTAEKIGKRWYYTPAENFERRLGASP
ncbi:MAG: Fic family protein [Candidatus Dadabacteria bacterium]|nr:Fic family protein [Candidatus Dadabacteria bacterium]